MREEKPAIDAHEAPPPDLKNLFKKYQKLSLSELEKDEALIDFGRGVTQLDPQSSISGAKLSAIFSHFTGESCTVEDQQIYSPDCLPGTASSCLQCSRRLQT